MSKKIQGQTGRVVIDERGRSVWQTPLSTGEIKTLADPLSLEGEGPAPGTPAAKRRTLDDMRKLSEQIKSSKVWYRAPKRRGPAQG